MLEAKDTYEGVRQWVAYTQSLPIKYSPIVNTQEVKPQIAGTTEEINMETLNFICQNFICDSSNTHLITFFRQHKFVTEFLPQAYEVIRSKFPNAELALNLTEYRDTLFIDIRTKQEYADARGPFFELNATWYPEIPRYITRHFNFDLEYV